MTRGAPADDPGGPFERDAVYPDELFTELLVDSARAIGTPPDDLLRDFGVYLGEVAFPQLAPAFFERHPDYLTALLAVEEQIHEVVRTALAGAAPPRLRVAALGRFGAVVAYTSERRLCRLVDGLLEGTAARYGAPVRIEEPQCMLRGDIACSFVVEVTDGERAEVSGPESS